MDSNDVRVALYRSFIETGRPPMPVDLAATTGHSPQEVEEALRRLADEDVIALVPGTSYVWLAHPFSAAAAPFRAVAGDMSWDAICIWDALGILALVERDGRVETRCPDCAAELTIEVRNGDVAAAEPYVAHYGVPASRWYEDVGYT